MHLKELEIQGFKSFGDRTGFIFGGGVTAIVGPNGSGKSNISDALRWALGEQSIKSLRGAKSEDVIFIGTEHRRSLGYAEVTVSFDNGDGALPVPSGEVTISRRLFRSGESEYYLNKAQCRLKDINDLFLDTGVGKDGYSIIGQGRIGEILSNRPEDRRYVFEEASGISKFKQRKADAERRLETVRVDALRLAGIIGELDGMLEGLQAESEKARLFVGLSNELRTLEVGLLMDSIETGGVRLASAAEELSAAEGRLSAAQKERETLESAIQIKASLARQLEQGSEVALSQIRGREAEVGRLSSERMLHAQTVGQIGRDNERLSAEAADLRQRAAKAEAEAGLKAGESDALRSAMDDAEAERLRIGEALRSMDGRIGERRVAGDALRAGLLTLLDSLSEAKASRSGATATVAQLEGRDSAIESELADISKSLAEMEGRLRDACAESAEAEAAEAECRGALEALRAERIGMEAEIAEAKSKAAAAESEMAGCAGRLKALSEMEGGNEGYGYGVRSVLSACERGALDGSRIRGALSRLITAERRMDRALEACLASNLQSVVTVRLEDAKEAIGFLKKTGGGRATFLPIESVKGEYINGAALATARKAAGFWGIGSDLVGFDEEYKGIILFLLGKVIFCESLESGVVIAKSLRHQYKVVTSEGDVLSVGGAVSGGSQARGGMGLLGRKREIEELKAKVIRIDAERRRSESLTKGLTARLDANALAADGLATSMGGAALRLGDARTAISAIKAESSSLERRAEAALGEQGRLAALREGCLKEAKEAEARAAELDAMAEARKGDITEAERAYAEEEGSRRAVADGYAEAQMAVGRAADAMKAVGEAVGRLEATAAEHASLAGLKEGEAASNASALRKLADAIGELDDMIEGYKEGMAELQALMDGNAAERAALLGELASMDAARSDSEKEVLAAQSSVHKAETARSRYAQEVASSEGRLADGYSLTFEGAKAEGIQTRKPVEVAASILGIKDTIGEMGYVNVGAIEDYAKAKDRHAFLSGQLSDLEGTSASLAGLIGDITANMREVFMERLGLIDENFGVVFRELFGGGSAHLSLAAGADALTGGIDIIAQPPGKKLQNMMGLSGGEKALTAIALLFGILRIKPAPFCVLDEIESSLDELNVAKFARYIRRLSGSTQFILITHKKGTMECADRIYGVTMEEYGVTKAVSMAMR
ncbi:MAG: chromosome segregation protein SMC [Oscillospiraceae bacterium]|nr:chromosome segregation protein SMC [Oscillospiraceae bacterium]